MKSVGLAGEPDTLACGARLAAAVLPARRRDGAFLVNLRGALGTGKTTLARGFLRALGVAGRIRSPTYTLIEIYPAAAEVIHVDLYRVAGETEASGLGLAEYDTPGAIWLIEWPERAAGLTARADLEATLAVAGEGRRLELAARSGHGREALAAFSVKPIEL